MAIETVQQWDGDPVETRGGGLLRAVHVVHSVAFGRETTLRDGRLTVSADQARAIASDPALREVKLSWVSPGDPVRIVKVLDVVEPRAKGPGGGGIFPGLLGPPRPQGRGTTHVLRGVAVLGAGILPRAQEAVIEMSGPGQPLSPFGSTHNLVLEFAPAPGVDPLQLDGAVRGSLLRLAAHLGETALRETPDGVEHLPAVGQRRPGHPRVVIITNLQTQGKFKDVFVYGRTLAGALPTLIEPGELDDGAVVSGQYGHPALRNPTYVHQNHPLLAALASDSELDLAAVMLCPEPVDQQGKELIAEHSARICELLEADGALITKEGGGNADADVALKLDTLAGRGIPAVGLLAEMPGPAGTGPSLVYAPTSADGLVSLGSYDERVSLPSCERALGGNRLEVADAEATAAMELPVAVHVAALSPLGAGRLTCAREPAETAAG
ncbi:MAG TPA: glycine/sarcosine/betaine reductase component B subunit [Solirubrobacteraceae bacterium]|nr:glycine/sarcosine/betaine reductase component B subunit [Solirubrobacteraceae bacterium]